MFNTVINDWQAWAPSRAGSRVRAQWAADTKALAGWTVSDLRQPLASPRTDAMQAALLHLAQNGDSAAATTLFVQLRPGLGSLAAWLARIDASDHRFESAANEVRSAFHEVVMHHDLVRRPRKIAANLILDTRQKLWRDMGRANRSAEVELESADVSGAASPTTDDLVERLHLRASLVKAIDDLGGSPNSRRLTAELAFRSWFLEEPGPEVAGELGLARNAARTRLCRLRRVVRTTGNGR